MHCVQGIICLPIALSQVHKDYSIIRSMSRIGTPTANPIIEAKNNWLKKEIYIFFQNYYSNIQDYINIIYNHNYLRPSYVLNYKTPIEFYTLLEFN